MMPRYKLRTLLVLLAIVPPLLAFSWWKYAEWKTEQATQKRAALLEAVAELRQQETRFRLLQKLRPTMSPIAAEAAEMEQTARLSQLRAAIQKLEKSDQ